MTPPSTESATPITFEGGQVGAVEEVRTRDGWMRGAALPSPASLSRKYLSLIGWLGFVLAVFGIFIAVQSLYWFWWDSQPLNYLSDRLFMWYLAQMTIGCMIAVGGIILALTSYMAVQSSMMGLRLRNECDEALVSALPSDSGGFL